MSTGARGTYVHVGRNGVYYRQKLGTSQSTMASTPSDQKNWETDSVDIPRGKVIESLKLKEVSDKPITIHVAYIFLTIAAIISTSYYALNNLNGSLGFLLLVAIPTSVWAVGVCCHYRAKLASLPPLHPLFYRLDTQNSQRFSSISKALETLRGSQSIWCATQSSALVQVAVQTPPLIVTNVDSWAVSVRNSRMFFMPDGIYIFAAGTYSSLQYEELKLSYGEQRVMTAHGHPSDAAVVDRTWLHTRKDGYADLRYKYNPSIPIVVYGVITMEASAGWRLVLQVSNREIARRFIGIFSTVIPLTGNKRPDGQQSQRSRDEDQRKRPPPPSRPASTRKSPYEVLGLKEGATIEVVTSAYRKQAQMNHPDRVANMAVEFRELAEKRMKEINAAYHELRSR